MNTFKNYMSRTEVLDYLNISEWKMKQLIKEELLIPDKLIRCNYGRKAYLFNVFKVVAVKRKLDKSGYHYKYS